MQRKGDDRDLTFRWKPPSTSSYKKRSINNNNNIINNPQQVLLGCRQAVWQFLDRIHRGLVLSINIRIDKTSADPFLGKLRIIRFAKI